MSKVAEESVYSPHESQVQELFHELDQRLGIFVDFNSCTLYGLEFWDKFESDLRKSLEIGSIDDVEQGRTKLSLTLKAILEEKQIEVLTSNFDSLLDKLVHHYFGLGILDDLLQDDSVYAMLVNGFDEIYFESRGTLQKSPFSFWRDAHFRHVMNRLCIWNNIDLLSGKDPIRTFLLPGNFSAMILFPPVTPNSPCLSITSRFAKKPLTIDQLIEFGTLSADI